MVYNIPFMLIIKYLPVSIASRDWFFLGCRNSIIVNFVAIFQKIIYILSSRFMNRILTGIRFDRTPPPPGGGWSVFDII